MALDGLLLQKLQQAMVAAFPNREDLEQVARFGLNVPLSTISHGKEIPATVFDLISWAESHDRLDRLIQAAYGQNPDSPELRAFVEQVWKPLQAQEKPTAPPGKQSNGSLIMPNTCIQAPSQEVQVANLQKKRTRRASNSKQKASDVRKDAGPLASPQSVRDGNIPRQNDQSAGEFMQSAHKNVEAARLAVQETIDLLQPEEDIFSDQCRFAVLQMEEACSAVKEISIELARIPSSHAPSRYLLETGQAFFCEETKEAGILLHQLSTQISSLYLRKSAWYKLQRLLKILQELDGHIDAFGEHAVHN